jgi:hypothetical protein
MNGTTSTLGRYGCLVSCFGIVTDTTPKVVNQLFAEKGAYSKDLVAWGGVANALPLDLISLPQVYDNTKVVDVIAREGFCIVEVDFDGIISTTADTHWVVYIGNHQCIDPWDGGTKPTASYPIAKMFVDFHKRVVVPPVTPPTPPSGPISDPQADIVVGVVGNPPNTEDLGTQKLFAVRSMLGDRGMKIKVQDAQIAQLQIDNQVLSNKITDLNNQIMGLNTEINDINKQLADAKAGFKQLTLWQKFNLLFS